MIKVTMVEKNAYIWKYVIKSGDKTVAITTVGLTITTEIIKQNKKQSHDPPPPPKK